MIPESLYGIGRWQRLWIDLLTYVSIKAILTLSLDCYSVQHVLSTQYVLVANIFAAVAIQLIAKYCVNTADMTL